MENLPVECISHILTFTSPKDVCRLAGVSSAFKSAAECDLLWKTFMPELVWEMIDINSSLTAHPYMHSLSNKELYFLLSGHPLLIEFDDKSISIVVDKVNEFICYMIGVKNLDFVSEEEVGIRHQARRFDPPSRFKDVAVVVHTDFVLDFGMDKKISLANYGKVYLVFNLLLENKTSILCRTNHDEETVPFDDAAVLRADGWTEIDVTGFLTGEEGAFIVFCLEYNFTPPPSGWIIIQGLEFRTNKFSKPSN